MLCTIIARDKPNNLETRMKARPDHLAYIEASGVTWVFAGPLLSDDGNTPQGSLFVGEFASLEAAREFSRNDPYTKAGVFADVSIQPARQTYPK